MDQAPFAVLRYQWQTPKPASAYGALWSDEIFEAIFNDHNSWSVGDYWERCTLGLMRPVFRVFPWRILRHAEADVADVRGVVIDLVRRQAADDGEILAGFAGVVAFVHGFPSDAGAAGRDARFDSGTASHEFFQHEVGHMLGFEHAFGNGDGPCGWPRGVYDDEYCVMGCTGAFAHSPSPIPPAVGRANLQVGVRDFWRSGRRPAAASLYRHLRTFPSSASVVRPPLNREFSLKALSSATPGEPVIAVFGVAGGEVSIEYRTNSDDDAEVAPAVVVHSFGMHRNPPGQNELRPTWLEAPLVPTAGSIAVVHGLLIKVVGSDARNVTLRVEPRLSIAVSISHKQSDWRWCNKCQGLFFGGGFDDSDCSAGNAHASPHRSGSGNYTLAFNVPGDPQLQDDWRWCIKCQGLFFGPGQPSSACPTGAAHASQAESQSGNYSLLHNVPADPDSQDQWRWCNKCQGLFFGPGQASSRCPAESNGPHASPSESGSANYCLPQTAF